MDLFTPIAPTESLHQNFVRMLHPDSMAVRDVLTGWAEGFVDRDRKFVKEFQTTFNSSFWELYLFAVLKHLKLQIDFDHPAPDFVCTDAPIAIEAAIANNSQNDAPEWLKDPRSVARSDVASSYRTAIIRASNAFLSKEAKHRTLYSKKPFMQKKSIYHCFIQFRHSGLQFIRRCPYAAPTV